VYAFCVWSVATAWPATTPEQRTTYLLAWGVNLFANVWWSILFFRRKRPDWALREVVLLWLSIVGVMAASWPADPRASFLLLPYLLWVSFASVLNMAIVRLNAPFSRT
jgi:tryptophan-rich sensory protein